MPATFMNPSLPYSGGYKEESDPLQKSEVTVQYPTRADFRKNVSAMEKRYGLTPEQAAAKADEAYNLYYSKYGAPQGLGYGQGERKGYVEPSGQITFTPPDQPTGTGGTLANPAAPPEVLQLSADAAKPPPVAAPAPQPAATDGSFLAPQGIRFQPAQRGASMTDQLGRVASSGIGTAQVGGRSIMGEYLDIKRAQVTAARLAQQGNLGAAKEQGLLALRKQLDFAQKYGGDAAHLAEQQIASRGIAAEDLFTGDADRRTENVVFPQYGEVLPGMGVATNAQGQIVRTVTGAPSGAPQTVYTPTAQGIQATSLVPRQTLMDPGLAAYLGASQITPEAARLSAAGLPAMQSALTKRERAQLQQQQIARADLTKAREAARSQYGLDLSPQPTGPGMPLDKALALGSDLLKSNSELEAKRGQTTDPAELARLSAMITNNNAQISRLQHKGVNVYRQNPETKDWELNTGGTAPKGLAATKEQVTPKAAALSPAKLEKDREDWKSEYGKAQAAAREASKEGGDVPADIMSTLRDLVKRSAKLGINVKPDGNWSIPAELKKAKPGGEVADDETAKAFLDAFDGDIGKASAALEAYGWKSK